MKLKEICEITGIEYNNKNPKRSLKEIEKYYIINKVGKRDYEIVRELNDDEKSLIRKCIPNVYINQFKVKDEDKHKSGVYKIILDKTIYIGQTKDLYERFASHSYKNGKNNHKTFELINNGALFKVIEFENNLKERLKKETYWSCYYNELGYNVINDFNRLYKNNNNNNITKFKNIKVPSYNYNKAIELLKKEGLI